MVLPIVCENVGNHIVFEETNKQLESTVSFLQYIIRCCRLVTFIGELHNKSFKCNKSSLSIAEYCKNATGRNPNCRVILEYYKDDDPLRMGSKAIRSSFRALERTGNKNLIIPLDYRPYFLTRKGQNDLYGGGWKTYNTHAKVRKAFVVPFLKHKSVFELNKNNWSEESEFLKIYVDNMVMYFRNIDMQLAEKKQLDDIREKLVKGWAIVADYFIIREILKKDDNVNEYILILGEAHIKNIKRVFNKININFVSQIGDYQNGKKRNCVGLFQTYRF
jgi:hypothetical protein